MRLTAKKVDADTIRTCADNSTSLSRSLCAAIGSHTSRCVLQLNQNTPVRGSRLSTRPRRPQRSAAANKRVYDRAQPSFPGLVADWGVSLGRRGFLVNVRGASRLLLPVPHKPSASRLIWDAWMIKNLLDRARRWLRVLGWAIAACVCGGARSPSRGVPAPLARRHSRQHRRRAA